MKKENVASLEFNERYFHDNFVYFKKIIFDDKELDRDGCKVQVIKIPKNSSVNPHYHERATEVFFCVEGECFLNKKRLKKGDIVLCKKTIFIRLELTIQPV